VASVTAVASQRRLVPAGEFGPGEQLLAEARVEFEQVGLDGVTLGHRPP
jgi:hypothetical protein